MKNNLSSNSQPPTPNPQSLNPNPQPLSPNIVISVEHLSKQYKLGTIGHGTLYRDLQSWWAKLRGKDDPNSLVTSKPMTRSSESRVQSSELGGKKSESNSKLRTQDSELRNDFWALRDVSFEVKRGEVVGIIGRNGAGKSTLLKILSRVTGPTSGSVKIKGRVASLLEVGTGFHPELTGRENIYLNGTILGMKKKEIYAKFDEIVAFAEIEQFIDTPVKRYSSGMYVRLAFAVAAHLEPEILIVDEVLAVGDMAFQKKCLGKMGEVSREGRTVLFVSHNMAAIQSLCSRAFLVDYGRIVAHGKTNEIVQKYLNLNITPYSARNLDEIVDRVGGYNLRMINFAITDRLEKSLSSIQCGQEVCFVIKFLVRLKEISNLRFGIAIFDNSTGKLVTELNSYYGSEDNYSCSEGTHEFVFSMNKMSLSPGKYDISVIITSGLDVLDWMKEICQIIVTEGNFYASGQMPIAGSYPVFFTDFECRIN